MKKLLFALVLGLLLVLALATVATADNGPHGGFSATTDACASCHRAHSAQFGSNALLIMDPEALCMSCHNGDGAGTNVQDGVFTQAGSNVATGGGANAKVEGVDGASLFGGGFSNALMATAWSGAATANPAFNAVSRTTTSTHEMAVAGTVWGSGAVNTPNGSLILECVSCHTPHGKAGFTNATTQTTVCDPLLAAASPATESCTVAIASYRLLRWQPQGSGGFTAPATAVNWSGGVFPGTGANTGWTVPDNYATNGGEWYTIGTQTTLANCGQTGTSACGGPFAVGDYAAGNIEVVYQPLSSVTSATQTYRPAAINTAFFCAQCHDRYFNNSSLRNATETSVYCGHPLNGTTPAFTQTATSGTPALLPFLPDADNAAPYIHPVDPTRCQAVVSTTTGLITGWGDNGNSGDTTYMFRHASGDIRLSMDASKSSGLGSQTRVSRSCVACHVSHGTTAAMTTPLATNASLAADSALLRLDNRSMCLRCHAGAVGFTVAP
ncbi:MAG: cytochrome c3 family protein [Chloroflexi bacterium]|nr:cytochrome c3 family protein [Chloroflexota bacterium]